MYKQVLLAALLAALTQGCAGSSSAAKQGDGAQTASTSQADLICQATRSTGSMLKNKRCRTKEQIEAEREEARNTMNSIHSSVAGTSGIERK